jgi:hypothetical protein
MNEHNNENTNPLHLSNDPELQGIESMLEQLAQSDRDAMPDQANTRVLEAISGVYAPQPIAIEQAQQIHTQSISTLTSVWKWRIAAGLLLVSVASLGLVITQPWATTLDAMPTNTDTSWSLTSFEQDLDAYLALDAVGDDQLDEAVADWELWAQTIDQSFDTELLGSDLSLIDLNDGAI